MNHPDPELMKRYGTEDVFLSKTSAATPLLAQLGLSILNFELANSQRHADQEQQGEDARNFEAKREFESARMQQATDPMRQGERAFVDHELPAEMVRLASIAVAAGADMAIKHAGIGDFVTAAKAFGGKALGALGAGGAAAGAGAAKAPGLMGKLTGGLGLKTNLALAGGTAAALYGTSKLLNKGTQTMRREPAGPATYGGQVRGMGYELPYGVNQYGQPQVGTPL